MRLGMFMMPVHPPGRSMSETLAEDTAKSILADQLGFDELWMGEHFSATTEPFPSPLMFLAGLVPQTKTITFGTAVINLPNHHPAIVAAEAAQFDHMSGGRFLFGVGSGGLAPDFELFDVFDGPVRQRKFLESIDLILKIWAQDPPYDLQGEFWNIQIKKVDRAGARLRRHAEAAAEAAPAGPCLDRQPRIQRPRVTRRSAAGASFPGRPRRLGRSPRSGKPTARPRARPASRQAAKTGGSRETSWWRRVMPKRRTACMASAARTAITSRTCGKRCSSAGGSR